MMTLRLKPPLLGSAGLISEQVTATERITVRPVTALRVTGLSRPFGAVQSGSSETPEESAELS